MKKEKTKPVELFTEKRVKLKPGTKVFENYHQAKEHSESRRSYVCHCYDEKGCLYGFFVAN